MKRALLVSVSFHLCMALVLVWPALYLGKRVSVPTVQHVRLIELPKPLAPAPPTPVKPTPKPPAPVAKPAPPKPLPPPTPEEVVEPADAQPPAEPDVLSTVPVVSAPSIIPKIDAPEFDCADYCRAFQRKVEGEWAPPPMLPGEEAQATIVFTINRNGEVEGVSVEVSSGNFYFDQAAHRAVLLAAPLPPLPRTFASPTLRVHLAFTLQPTR